MEPSQMTFEQLEAELTSLHLQQKVIKARKRAIAAVMDRKAIDAAAAQRVATMSDAEKEALRAALG